MTSTSLILICSTICTGEGPLLQGHPPLGASIEYPRGSYLGRGCRYESTLPVSAIGQAYSDIRCNIDLSERLIWCVAIVFTTIGCWRSERAKGVSGFEGRPAARCAARRVYLQGLQETKSLRDRDRRGPRRLSSRGVSFARVSCAILLIPTFTFTYFYIIQPLRLGVCSYRWNGSCEASRSRARSSLRMRGPRLCQRRSARL